MRGWIAMVGLLGLLGCDRGPNAKGQSAPESQPTVSAAAGPERKAPPPVEAKLPKLDFAFAKPAVTRMALPARFSAALAPTYEAFEAHPQQYPPSPYVTERLCAGDVGMQRRVLAAWQAATKAKALPLGYASGCEGLCRWAVGVAEDATLPDEVRRAAVAELSSCYAPLGAVKRVMGRPIAPAHEVQSWLLFASHEGVTPGYLPSMPRVLAEGKKAPNATFGQRLAAVSVGHVDDPQIAKVLLDYHASLRDPALKRAVAYGMHEQSDPRARKAFAAACKTKPATEGEALCGPRAERHARHGLDAKVRDHDFDVEGHLERHPNDRKALLAALRRGIAREPLDGEDGDAFEAAWCITKLARLDWPAAREAARQASPDVRKSLDATALLAFDDNAAMLAGFDALGWKLKPTRKPTPTTVRDVLLQGGRAKHFDTETGTYPNHHDELMFELARLVDGELEGAIFAEIAPGLDGRDDYVLEAYLDGSRYVVRAKNLGDWYDVEATLGLLNALLAMRKSTWRYGVVDTGGQDIIVVAAPERTLARTAKAGLIELAEAQQAVEAGKRFEQQVLDHITK